MHKTRVSTGATSLFPGSFLLETVRWSSSITSGNTRRPNGSSQPPQCASLSASLPRIFLPFSSSFGSHSFTMKPLGLAFYSPLPHRKRNDILPWCEFHPSTQGCTSHGWRCIAQTLQLLNLGYQCDLGAHNGGKADITACGDPKTTPIFRGTQ